MQKEIEAEESDSGQKRTKKITKKRNLKKFEDDALIKKRFDLDVMAFLSNCSLPYSFVETRGFKHFLEVLEPKHTLKSRHIMSHQISPLMHHNLKKCFEETLSYELPHCESVSFTYDTWTTRANHGYLTLTIHYISPKFELRQFTVDCRSTEKKKDDRGIASLISSMISSISG
jgi:hypothetical protein